MAALLSASAARSRPTSSRLPRCAESAPAGVRNGWCEDSEEAPRRLSGREFHRIHCAQPKYHGRDFVPGKTEWTEVLARHDGVLVEHIAGAQCGRQRGLRLLFLMEKVPGGRVYPYRRRLVRKARDRRSARGSRPRRAWPRGIPTDKCSRMPSSILLRIQGGLTVLAVY